MRGTQYLYNLGGKRKISNKDSLQLFKYLQHNFMKLNNILSIVRISF